MALERLAKGCAAGRPLLHSIQKGTMGFAYKGVLTHKSPFDLALYQMLLWDLKPRTLIEIGSKWGGSALWFADLLRAYGVDFVLHSVDVSPPADAPETAGVTFHAGDGRDLSRVLSTDLLSKLPRPWMIVEDADHHAITTLAVLRFFDPWLRPGDYIVVEDGIVDDLYPAALAPRFGGGPRAAIAEFLEERSADYEIDARLCDFYGVNMTWNVNGYLRRTG